MNAVPGAYYAEQSRQAWNQGNYASSIILYTGAFVDVGFAFATLGGSTVEETVGRSLSQEAVRFHHPWPKYLGGKLQQILEPLPKVLHDAYHSGLDKILPRQAGTGCGFKT